MDESEYLRRMATAYGEAMRWITAAHLPHPHTEDPREAAENTEFIRRIQARYEAILQPYVEDASPPAQFRDLHLAIRRDAGLPEDVPDEHGHPFIMANLVIKCTEQAIPFPEGIEWAEAMTAAVQDEAARLDHERN